MRNEQITEIEDTSITAYLLMKGHKFMPIRKSGGRISFRFTGDITADLEDIYNNKTVGILDYIKSLKTVRSSIFTLKAIGVNHE